VLSYRHAFHAGNYADVIKHLMLCRILAYLAQKPAPMCYVDTHAGAGAYDLTGEHAGKTGEYHQGIGLLWQRDDLPPVIDFYRELVSRFNDSDSLSRYPGSPWIAQQLLREQDRLELCELHSSEFPLLQQNFARDRRVRCHFEDGFGKSIALLPPREKRGLVLIDPSYEVKDDYHRVVELLQKLHKRFATGVYALWYPVVDRRRVAKLEADLVKTGIHRVDLYEIDVAADGQASGMTGAGMIVINPPWKLREEMAGALAWLAPLLSQDGQPRYRVEELAGEK